MRQKLGPFIRGRRASRRSTPVERLSRGDVCQRVRPRDAVCRHRAPLQPAGPGICFRTWRERSVARQEAQQLIGHARRARPVPKIGKGRLITSGTGECRPLENSGRDCGGVFSGPGQQQRRAQQIVDVSMSPAHICGRYVLPHAEGPPCRVRACFVVRASAALPFCSFISNDVYT